MDIKRYQSGSYNVENALEARELADRAGDLCDAGNIEEAIALWEKALKLEPPLRFEATILVELADALAESLKPIASGEPYRKEQVLERLDWIEKILIRIRELLSVPSPFDIPIEKIAHIEGNPEFDSATYLREEEKQDPCEFVEWCGNLCRTFRESI